MLSLVISVGLTIRFKSSVKTSSFFLAFISANFSPIISYRMGIWFKSLWKLVNCLSAYKYRRSLMMQWFPQDSSTDDQDLKHENSHNMHHSYKE